MLTDDPARIPAHQRDVTYRSFLRPDGLWDIEGTLRDRKGYAQDTLDRGPMEAGEPIHHMRIRLTIDDGFVVQAAEVEMPATPFDLCQQAKAPMAALVGCRIGGGWRKAINERMGGEAGCTHLRELLSGMGTAAFQTVGRYRAHERRLQGLPEPVLKAPRPPMGECLGWSFDGDVMRRHRPEFFGWRPPAEPEAEGDAGARPAP